MHRDFHRFNFQERGVLMPAPANLPNIQSSADTQKETSPIIKDETKLEVERHLQQFARSTGLTEEEIKDFKINNEGDSEILYSVNLPVATTNKLHSNPIHIVNKCPWQLFTEVTKQLCHALTSPNKKKV
jgi:hypothetical protein